MYVLQAGSPFTRAARGYKKVARGQVVSLKLPARQHSAPKRSSAAAGAERDEEEDGGGWGGGGAAVRVVGGGGAEVQCHLQLRRLHHRHRQPLHQREAVADHLHAAALRRDLLRHAHLPLLRRPRRRRLPQQQVRPAVPAAVQVDDGGLQEGRQHGDHGRDGHGRALLPVAGPLRQDLEQRAHQLPAAVVPADRLLHLRQRRLQELPGQLPLRLRRVRRQRLQRHALRQLQHRPGQHLHAADRQHHRQRRREADRHGGQGHRRAGRAPHRLLPHLPHHLRHLQQRRLRQPRLPQEVQRPVDQPQQPAQAADLQPPGQVRLRPHHVRRLLLRRLRHGQEPRQLRVQHGVPDVLRVGRRQVQLPEQRAVRDVGGVGVLQPGGAPQLGRHPPHRGSLQADHRRVAQRALLQPGHPPQLNTQRGQSPKPVRTGSRGRASKARGSNRSINRLNIHIFYTIIILLYLCSRCRAEEEKKKKRRLGNGTMWNNRGSSLL